MSSLCSCDWLKKENCTNICKVALDIILDVIVSKCPSYEISKSTWCARDPVRSAKQKVKSPLKVARRRFAWSVEDSSGALSAARRPQYLVECVEGTTNNITMQSTLKEWLVAGTVMNEMFGLECHGEAVGGRSALLQIYTLAKFENQLAFHEWFMGFETRKSSDLVVCKGSCPNSDLAGLAIISWARQQGERSGVQGRQTNE